KVLSGASASGFLTTLRRIETASMTTAKRIGAAFKSAFSFRFGQVGPAGGALRFLGGAAKGFGGGASAESIGESAAGGIKLATAGAIAAGVYLAKQANDVFESANRLSIASRGAGRQGADPTQLMGQFFQVAQDVRGQTAEGAAAAAAKFVQMTGDLETARASLTDFAIAASASGADMESVAGTSAAISQQFAITDPRQIREVLAALIFQGKTGAFELKDAADLFPRLAAAGAAFGLDKGVGGVKTLGGLTQIARTGTGTGEQAATAVENLLTNLKLKSDDLKKAGVKVYDKGKTRDLPSILIDAIAKVGGKNVEKKQAGLSQIFGEQGIRAINPMISKFNDVFVATGSTEKAMQALRDMINSSINAPGNWADVIEDSARAQSTSSATVTAAMEKLKERVGAGALPVLTDFIDKLANSPEVIDAFVQSIKLMTMMVDGFIIFLKDLHIIDKGASPQEKAKRELAREERRRADKATAELESIMLPQAEIEALQKSDPKKVERFRARAFELQTERDVALGSATRLEDEAKQMAISEGRMSKERLQKFGPTAQEAAAAIQEQTGFGTRAAGPGKQVIERGKGKTEVTNEVRVRIVNTADLAAAGVGPAPVQPGYLSPR
ncbi:MAG TPA: phage tail tape measure protein, partial [Vicinamibacterales bacterium]|nr:phage tail tape measure protein [Vicinamibacterales bacterium]